jgi:tRNA 2-thiouridine synthesizing protein A
MSAIKADKVLDVRGLSCPLPVLKANRAMATVPAGGTLEVVATDPNAPDDFEAFCRTMRHILVEAAEAGDTYRFLIRKSS